MQNDWQNCAKIDFASNDIFSWNASGALRAEFLAELAKHPDFCTGAGGSRLLDGNYPYIEDVEQEIAAFHGAEAGLVFPSGFDANIAVWSAIPRPGDVIVYDELVHASTHEGIAQSLAMQKVEFPHNNVRAFQDVLRSILATQPLVRQGRRSILVAVEGVYSMDGDICPLEELVEVADEMFQGEDNIQFVVDEAHSTGLLGPKGAGLVCELGLETQIAVRVHTFGKCMGSSGAIVLGNPTVTAALINFARSVTYSTAPPFPLVAAIKAGYNILRSEQGQEARDRVQYVASLFYAELTSHPAWRASKTKGLLSVPLAGNWESRPFLSHITTLRTRPRYLYWLTFHLHSAGFCVWPIEHPVVPVGQGRIKISMHAGNTDAQVRSLVEAIFKWVEEITSIEEGVLKDQTTQAAGEVYSWMKSEGLDGFGMV